ncbi:hypothetical protein [Streptomyces sp. NPDC018321]|uniref:hypothetical protein n=1 Tax=unclassified Streptomyces TaxID=2593676 RepID=UPI00378E34B8
MSTTLAALVLAGCGGGGSPDATDANKGSASPSRGASPDPEGPSELLTVPSAYDAKRGWQHTLDWMPEDYEAQPLTAVGTRTDTVAYVDTTEDGYVVQVRDASTGAVRFTSRPWDPPAPTEADGLMSGPVLLPSVATAVQDGREYVVLWAHGETGGDALNKGKQSVRLQVFPADASGSAVAPAREIDIPVELSAFGEDRLRVADFGTGLEVHWESENTDRNAVAVDVTSGTLDRCADACAEGIGRIGTDEGWVVSDRSQGAVSMPGVWDIRDAAPPGATYPDDTASNEFVGVAGGHLLTRWQAESGSVVQPLTALHDATTGKLETSVVCDRPDGEKAVASPDGRFVAAGTVAFDLQRRSGHCLDAGAERKASVYIWSIADGGTAYGTLDDTRTDNEQTAEVDLSTGTPRLLPEGTLVPDLTLKTTGVFLTPSPTYGLLISVLHTR